MRFFTCILAACTLTAVPASAQMIQSVPATQNFQTLDQAATHFNKPNMPKKLAKVSSSAEDIVGTYTWFGYSYLASDQDQLLTNWVNIAKGDTDSELKITLSIRPDSPIPAEIDYEKGEITFNRCELAYNSYYEANETFLPYTIDENGKLVIKNKITGNIDENGNIVFPEDGVIGLGVKGKYGWFWLSYGNVFERPDFFVYNEDEWEPLGTAMYDDPWMKALLIDVEEPTPYQVEVKKNKADSNLLCIMNPYGTQSPYDNVDLMCFNMTPEDAGYVVLDVTDPGCVLTRMYTYSGFTMDNSTELDGSNLQKLYCFNREGLYAHLGLTTDDIAYGFGSNDIPISTFDAETGKIIIENAYFGISTLPAGQYSWTGMASGSITFDPSGVNEVNVGNDVSVRYYNLQGVEVANPVKGQLVIKLNGSQSSKVVM